MSAQVKNNLEMISEMFLKIRMGDYSLPSLEIFSPEQERLDHLRGVLRTPAFSMTSKTASGIIDLLNEFKELSRWRDEKDIDFLHRSIERHEQFKKDIFEVTGLSSPQHQEKGELLFSLLKELHGSGDLELLAVYFIKLSALIRD